MYNMPIESTLSELGLKKSKGVVYLSALGLGPSSSQEIAEKSGLPRTTTIEVLERLVEMGLMSYVEHGRKREYTAEPPEKLKILLDERERRLKEVLPELKSMVSTKGRRPKVRMYEGLEGVKAVFEDTLTAKDRTLRGILSMADLYKVPGRRYMNDYVRRRISKGYSLCVIRSEQKEVEETWPTSVEEQRELRYAPADVLFPMTVYIYDNKVGIIGTEKENFGMIIESQDYYQTQKNLFELTWQVSRISHDPER